MFDAAIQEARDALFQGMEELFPPFQKLLLHCRDKSPRNSPDKPVSLGQLTVLCRVDRRALAFAGELGPLLERAALALYEKLKVPLWIPRSADATAGDRAELTPGDRADGEAFLRYLLVTTFAAQQALVRLAVSAGVPPQGIGRHAVCHVFHSLVEALFFTFLKSRFPGMFYRGEQDETGEAGGAARSEQSRDALSDLIAAKILRKNRLLTTVLELLATADAAFEKQLRALPEPRMPVTARVASLTYFHMHLKPLRDGLLKFAGLEVLAEHCKTPRPAQPIPPLPDPFPQPAPDLEILTILETEPDDKWCQQQVTRFRRHPGLTHTMTAVAGLKYLAPQTQKEIQFGAGITLHRTGGAPCLTHMSHIPLRKLFHPEDPAMIMADFIARNCQHNLYAVRGFCEVFDLQDTLSTVGGVVPKLRFFRVVCTPHAGAAGDSAATVDNLNLIISRNDALPLGLNDVAQSLPYSARMFLKSHGFSCPEDPLLVVCDIRGDDGGDDDDPQPLPVPDDEALERDNTHDPVPADIT